MKRLIIILMIMLIANYCHASIIFQDNFDTCTTNCNSCGTDYWDVWNTSGGCSATYGSTTHYSGEMVSPGRSGSGKLYKVWRHSTSWPDFSGGLLKYLPGSYNDMWFRYYIKIPAAMGLNGEEYCKWWIINPSGGEGVYLDIIDWEPGAGRLDIINYNIEGTSTVTVLNSTDTAAILDGNWHSLQFHFNNTTQIGTLQLYVDGVIKYNNTSYDWGTTAAWYMLQHFHIGNRGSGTVWQNSWQAFEIDDFVIATTKAETDPIGGGDDTTPPVISNPLPSTTQSCDGGDGYSNPRLVSLQVTTDELATCKWGQYPTYTSSTSYEGLPNTFNSDVITRQTSHVQSVSNACDSLYTYYVRCRDSYDNDSTASTAISYSVSEYVPPPSRVVYFTEEFDDNNFSDRSWFDDTSLDVDTTTYQSGTGSLRLAWGSGQTNPPLVVTSRKGFTATDKLYMRWFWRFNSNWVGSGVGYHPHIIYVLSDLDNEWSGLACNYLDTYIEPRVLTPLIIIQDGANINYDSGSLPNDLTSTTETRDVSGCNGCLSGSDCGSAGCYDSGGGIGAVCDGSSNPAHDYWNGRFWSGTSDFGFNTWHKTEVYLEMNTISDSIAQPDGIMWMKIDDIYVMNRNNIVYRTNENASLKWKTFIIAPWIGDGSPQAQTMWMDSLEVANSSPDTETDVSAPVVTISTTDPSSITSDSLSIGGTALDAIWGSGSVCKWRLSSAPDGSNGTACTGTTSWTCSASGFSRGANTLYVGCGDAAGNWGSDSMVVNYLPVIQGVTGLGISFR